jgi:hypothetical protein
MGSAEYLNQLPEGEPASSALGEQFKRIGLDDRHRAEIASGLQFLGLLQGMTDRRSVLGDEQAASAPLEAPEEYPKTA